MKLISNIFGKSFETHCTLPTWRRGHGIGEGMEIFKQADVGPVGSVRSVDSVASVQSVELVLWI